MELIVGIICLTAVSLFSKWLSYRNERLDIESHYKYGEFVPEEENPDDWWKNCRN